MTDNEGAKRPKKANIFNCNRNSMLLGVCSIAAKLKQGILCIQVNVTPSFGINIQMNAMSQNIQTLTPIPQQVFKRFRMQI